ncbi:MAG: hypothetical protein EHM23_14390 [Acidobacteria bacterium]|nr:MAG: hypothetical protein EHM23_14390 [Acidobacteriota bacterium]
MGRKSRAKRERRDGWASTADQERQSTIDGIEQRLTDLADGDMSSWASPDFPTADRQTYLEDVLAFESVGSGPSLFEGLEAHGVNLPRPEDLDQRQSLDKLREIVEALANVRVFLIGFEHLTPCEFYETLWNETLWEGCYVEKRHPGAMTLMDVSHSIPRSEIMQYLRDLQRRSSVQ